MISKKTWLVPLLTVVMLMSLCACGKSDNAKVCESLINKIGEVTLDSEKTIRVADEAYDALTEEEKVQIKKSAEKLSESRDAYNQLLIDTKLGSVEELIDAIGEVTLDSEKAIINAAHEKVISHLLRRVSSQNRDRWRWVTILFFDLAAGQPWSPFQVNLLKSLAKGHSSW